MPISQRIALMVDMLPDTDQALAFELIKKLVLAWDPDFTKVTPEERAAMDRAIDEFDAGDFVTDDQINWN